MPGVGTVSGTVGTVNPSGETCSWHLLFHGPRSGLAGLLPQKRGLRSGPKQTPELLRAVKS